MDGSAAPATEPKRLGEGLSLARMPAHWMLGRLGKSVMRPGGFEPSRRMIEQLAIGPDDDLVEMWPGLGRTTTLALAGRPRSYVGIERGQAEAARARAALTGSDQRCIIAPAHQTGLPTDSASVLFGEALLSLEPDSRKVDIVGEASRLLRPGGRYGIHELLLTPDDLSDTAKSEIQAELTKVLRIGARPLTRPEWHRLLADQGFTVRSEETTPLLLLDPRSVVADEGISGVATMFARAVTHPEVLPRLATMLRTFHRYRHNLGAITIIAEHGHAQRPG